VGNAQARFKADGCTFSLLDDSIVDQAHADRVGAKAWASEYPPVSRLTNLRAEIEAALAHGSQEVFVADSLEELAGSSTWHRATPSAATVEELQRLLRPGHDGLVRQGPPLLAAARPAALCYAVRARAVVPPALWGASRGHQQAGEWWTRRTNVIPGLYAGGFDAGGM